MRWPVVVVIALSGCHAFLGIDDFQTAPDAGVDTSSDAEIDAPSDSLTCLGTLKSICFTMPPSGDLVLAGTIDTSTDARCANYPQSGGADLCVIAGATITVGTVRVTGAKPLVLAAMTTISVTVQLDASSIGVDVGGGANGAGCTVTTGQAQISGGGGGGGGGFGAVGAAGGRGANGGNPGLAGAPIAVTQIRGGCPGGKGGDGENGSGGRVGASGGALALLAGTSIQIAGGVYASGAGGGGGSPASGNRGAGGGGGSGGLIVLEAPTINVVGTVTANGGGGGGGADGGNGSAGSDGARANYNSVAQGGNREGGSRGGDGGDGGYLAVAAMIGFAPPASGFGGGGGGGGGVGVIWVHGAVTGTRFSPAVQMH